MKHLVLIVCAIALMVVCASQFLRAEDKAAPPKVTGRNPLQPNAPAKKISWKVGDTWSNSLGMKFAYIPPGTFMMGSPASDAERIENELQHRVKITKPFLMATTNVTRGQFAAFVADSGYKTDAERAGWAAIWDVEADNFKKTDGASWRNPGFPQGDDHPVLEVSWDDAVAYCAWLSKKDRRHYQLPTEARWEYACRAGTQTVYFWGDDPDGGAGFANCGDRTLKDKYPDEVRLFKWRDGFVFTSPVGSFKPNQFGLYDMIGNAAQWCADFFDDYPAAEATDPSAPFVQSGPVIRGGSWFESTRGCRCANREYSAPDFQSFWVGFRVCLDL